VGANGVLPSVGLVTDIISAPGRPVASYVRDHSQLCHAPTGTALWYIRLINMATTFCSSR